MNIATTCDLRRQLLEAVAATFGPDEEILPTETACERLTIPVAAFYPDADDEDQWDPDFLAAALRRLGVFTADGFWPTPHNGLDIVRAAVQGELDCLAEDSARSGAPAFDEEPWWEAGGPRFTTAAGDQIHVYPGGAGMRVQVIGSDCGAPETQVIAELSHREVGRLVAALQGTGSDDEGDL